MPGIIQIIKGEAKLTLGYDSVEANTGAWIHMPAGLRHGVYAKTPLVMLLVLVKSRGQKTEQKCSRLIALRIIDTLRMTYSSNSYSTKQEE